MNKAKCKEVLQNLHTHGDFGKYKNEGDILEALSYAIDVLDRVEVSKIHRVICGDVPWSVDDCELADALAKSLKQFILGEKTQK